MAATKIGIVYAAGSGMVRYWVVPDSDAELDAHSKRVWPGESYLPVDRSTIKSPADIEAAVTKVTGKPCPLPVRAAFIDASGVVFEVALIDPDLDPGLPRNKNIAVVVDAVAEVGWEIAVDGSLQAPVSVDPLPISTVDPASVT